MCREMGIEIGLVKLRANGGLREIPKKHIQSQKYALADFVYELRKDVVMRNSHKAVVQKEDADWTALGVRENMR